MFRRWRSGVTNEPISTGLASKHREYRADYVLVNTVIIVEIAVELRGETRWIFRPVPRSPDARVLVTVCARGSSVRIRKRWTKRARPTSANDWAIHALVDCQHISPVVRGRLRSVVTRRLSASSTHYAWTRSTDAAYCLYRVLNRGVLYPKVFNCIGKKKKIIPCYWKPSALLRVERAEEKRDGTRNRATAPWISNTAKRPKLSKLFDESYWSIALKGHPANKTNTYWLLIDCKNNQKENYIKFYINISFAHRTCSNNMRSPPSI